MTKPSFAESLLIACDLAVRVECKPMREDGSYVVVYASSGRTLALRVKKEGAIFAGSRNSTPLGSLSKPADYYYHVSFKVKSARETTYTVWLKESPEQVEQIHKERKMAAELRASLPHGARKKKPWGTL